jgi:hypothetical protein
MFTPDELLEIHYGIHSDVRGIFLRDGLIPVNIKVVDNDGLVRYVRAHLLL